MSCIIPVMQVEFLIYDIDVLRSVFLKKYENNLVF
ncbi:hypothetical protein T09_3813 [Trichinella sp. T9]|nr:hypothetical protein T09_3813 [Trichinella sp. T9]